ncbi:hypothetical protein [Pseudoteredinibacter isoporae]|uniref:Uncharacterized protein n=1 Tax=Pseudoteredinibacter isoporae TaxID=570281 RepID=A0A7X0JT25_9GAMM|nr:hypothetical protein [Pseudoteredinibacter isoporae]MBB6521773.1 hypothetical protein [Pseudoteredinibacter isoporae]NHO87320.1 hypothetical protein [Pseudoteredinibacter isoporae]NIB23048.1 hypothetical protein [Pseudoteredinibacter isoporae]
MKIVKDHISKFICAVLVLAIGQASNAAPNKKPFVDVLAYLASSDTDPHRVEFYRTLANAYPLIEGEKLLALIERDQEILAVVRIICGDKGIDCNGEAFAPYLEDIYSNIAASINPGGKKLLPKKILPYKGMLRMDIDLSHTSKRGEAYL